jgi:hypothetical protein
VLVLCIDWSQELSQAEQERELNRRGRVRFSGYINSVWLSKYIEYQLIMLKKKWLRMVLQTYLYIYIYVKISYQSIYLSIYLAIYVYSYFKSSFRWWSLSTIDIIYPAGNPTIVSTRCLELVINI